MELKSKSLKITGDWGLLLIKSCHPKYTNTQMLIGFIAFVYLNIVGVTTLH